MNNENADQKDFWDKFAQTWVTRQAELDGLMAPVLDGVFDRAGLTPGQRVLDIGCGTGTSTLLAAQSVGATGRVLGVDISEPMLERARALAKGIDNVDFVTADAAHFGFDPNGFDAVFSRFGVMFFANPVTAFANIRLAMKSGASITMATWANLKDNPWFQVPMYAAKDRLGAPPPVPPDAPGPLSLSDVDRVTGILTDAGYVDVRAETVDMLLTPPGDVDAVAHHASSIGPASRAIEYFDATEADFHAIAQAVAQGFAKYQTKGAVQVPASINFFSATAP